MLDIYDIVKDEIFSKIDNSVVVRSVESLLDGKQKIKLCKNKWIRKNGFLTDSNDVKYRILSIDNDGTLTIETSTALNVGDKFNIIAPKWLFGTRISANNEYKNDLLPVFWFTESLADEEEFGVDTDGFERISEMTFFLLDDFDSTHYLNEDNRYNVVNPMMQLFAEVKSIIQDNPIFEPSTFRVKTITRLIDESVAGVIKSILDDNLSGLRVKVRTKIFKDSSSCGCY